MVSLVKSHSLQPPDKRTRLQREIVLSVSLRISGNELDPASVTNALNVKPTESAKKGGLLREKGLHQLKTDVGVWFSKIRSLDLSVDDRLPADTLIAPEIIQRLRRVPNFDLIELSFLLNGPEQIVIRFVHSNAEELANRLSSEAAYVEVDLDIPTAGIDIVLRKGQKLDPTFLRQQLVSPAAPLPQ